MVTLIRIMIIFALWLAIAPPASGDATASTSGAIEFRMEFSKPEIFSGEQVLCSFQVYSKNPVVEVEVAKFPEFRGYWNENLSLRQGPLSTMPTADGSAFVATVGTYLLTPMLGQRDPTIEPMKIALRSPNQRTVEGSSPPEFVFSKSVPLTIKPLPPLSLADEKRFIGGVGKLSVITYSTPVLFQAGEPTTFSYGLMGQANFQEINELPIALTAPIELVNQRTYLQGGAQSAAKTFEYSVTLNNSKDYVLPSTEILYFNPELATYQTLVLPEVKFLAQAKSSLASSGTAENSLLALSPHYSPTSLTKSPPYWTYILHLCLAIFALSMIVNKARQRRSPAQSQNTGSNQDRIENRTRLLNAMEAARQRQSTSDFLLAAEAYVFALITERMPPDARIKLAPLSRPELLTIAKPQLSDEELEVAMALNSLTSRYLYGAPEMSTHELPAINQLADRIRAVFPVGSA